MHTLLFRYRFAGCTKGQYIGDYPLFGRFANGSIGTGVQELAKLAFVLPGSTVLGRPFFCQILGTSLEFQPRLLLSSMAFCFCPAFPFSYTCFHLAFVFCYRELHHRAFGALRETGTLRDSVRRRGSIDFHFLVGVRRYPLLFFGFAFASSLLSFCAFAVLFWHLPVLIYLLRNKKNSKNHTFPRALDDADRV